MTLTTPPTEPADHGFEIKTRKKWIWIGAGLVVVLVAILGVRFIVYGDTKSPNEIPGATLYVVNQEGYSAEQELIEFVGREVAPRYGIKVAFKGLADSNAINRAISDGEVAATTFEHTLWLNQVLEANPDFKLTAAGGPIFRWGFGVWSSKYKDVQEIPDGSTISLTADPANEALGLWYLAQAGLITLPPDKDKFALTHRDIASNPKNLKFTLLDYGAQPRGLSDVAAAVGYNSEFVQAGIPLDRLIFSPPTPDEYAGVLVIGTQWADTENIKNLVAAWHDPAVQEYLRTNPIFRGRLLPA